jgi:hypothetical protein
MKQIVNLVTVDKIVKLILVVFVLIGVFILAYNIDGKANW